MYLPLRDNWQFFNMYWCYVLFVISCCFSLPWPWEMKEPSLLDSSSVSHSHSHGHMQQEAAESQWKEGRWLVKKLPLLFWFPILNGSSWPFQGSSCSFDFSTPKWPVLVFHVIVGMTGVREQGTECPWTYCTLKGQLCHVTFIDRSNNSFMISKSGYFF